ncbi:hypothetical protein MUN74_11785 [Agromyces endophyticus]|uniref:hypothetical protein n=1 Tax=Agromyces sp. H17E-10 TaxID=2932244 RepID=UPI001FD3ECF6|nr:hypothetical protein [Agromyces sp. H17E-10]UOQ87976.1 hypothetical protein MUN74_11785 [Agromyces sp. H17E-10]
MTDESQPWWRDDGTGSIGFARFFAWTGLLLGAGALVIALFAPLDGQALRCVWTVGFGCAGIWVAGMGLARYRRAGVRRSWVVRTAFVLGGLAVLVAAYAFVVIWLASAGIDLPAPGYWLAPPPPTIEV